MLSTMEDYKYKNFYQLCKEILEVETRVRSKIECNEARYDLVFSEVIEYIGEKGMLIGTSQEYCDSISLLILECSGVYATDAESESMVDLNRQELAELRLLDDDSSGDEDLEHLVSVFGQATSYANRPIWPGVPNPLANLILKIMEFLDKLHDIEEGSDEESDSNLL